MPMRSVITSYAVTDYDLFLYCLGAPGQIKHILLHKEQKDQTQVITTLERLL